MLTLDAATRAEYDAQSLAADKGQAVVGAIVDPVSVTIRDDTDAVRASGTMGTPWATVVGDRIVIGEVTSFAVTSGAGGAIPAGWTLRFESGARSVEGSFGHSGTDFTWSLPTFETGQGGYLGTVEFVPQGNVAVQADYSPSWSVGAPVTKDIVLGWTVAAAGSSPLTFSGAPNPIPLNRGGTYDLSQHVTGGVPPYTYDHATYALPTGVTLDFSTGLLSASSIATTGTTADITFGVTDSDSPAGTDWIARSTAAGVVWAHNFEADAELYNFVRGDPGSGTVTNPDPASMPNGLYLEATPFGSSRAIVGRAVGTTFTQATPSGTAGDIHTFHVADASQLPNPSPQYRLLIGDPSDPQKGCFEYVDFISRDLVNNTISVRRRRTSETMPADPVSVAYPGAPSYPIGWTIGRGPMGSWNRPLCAFPAGQNGKSTPDVGIANGVVTKARVWNPTRGGNGHLSFREGYWGSRHYWDTAVNPSAPYRNWTPADPADNTTRADAWDGDEFYLQFRFKCSASRLTEYATKLLYIQNAFNSGTGQIFAAVGEKKFNEQPAPGEAAPGVTYGRFMQWLCGGGDSRQPAGGYLFSDFQGDGNDQGSNAYQLGYPACNYTNRSGSGMYCWCYPAEEWVTVLLHVKFGRDNAELSASPTPPFLSASDPTFRTLFEVSVVSPGETAYRKLISIPDATWFFGDSIGDLQNYFYNPPGLNAVWLTQELNSYIGAGSVAPPTESHSIAFTEAILSTQPIPAPAV
jgi:hypothetical protein